MLCCGNAKAAIDNFARWLATELALCPVIVRSIGSKTRRIGESDGRRRLGYRSWNSGRRRSKAVGLSTRWIESNARTFDLASTVLWRLHRQNAPQCRAAHARLFWYNVHCGESHLTARTLHEIERIQAPTVSTTECAAS